MFDVINDAFLEPRLEAVALAATREKQFPIRAILLSGSSVLFLAIVLLSYSAFWMAHCLWLCCQSPK